jgi:DNA-binding transcriptional regulator YhcF (GntR family)
VGAKGGEKIMGALVIPVIGVIGVVAIATAFVTAGKLEASWNETGHRKKKEAIETEKSIKPTIQKTQASPKGGNKMKDIYKNKPGKYLYSIIVDGIIGKDSYREEDKVPPIIKPNEALPSFEELAEEYPPKLIKRIFKRLKCKGYVVERNGKLIVVDTKIARKIDRDEYNDFNSKETLFIVVSAVLTVAFVFALLTAIF